MDIHSVFRRLATEAYENGNYARCVEYSQRVGDPIPQDLREMVCDSAYKCGLRLTVNGKLDGARKMLSCALTLAGTHSRRRLCDDRLKLLRQRPQQLPSDVPCPICIDESIVHSVRWLDHCALAPEVDTVFCVGAYRSGFDPQQSNVFSECIRRAKGQGGDSYLDGLTRILQHFAATHLEPELRASIDLIIPIPTAAGRFVERGYCVPTHLGREISQYLSIPVYCDVLLLERETGDLRRLNEAQRRRELEGAFTVSDLEMIQGYRVMIVDDVTTYGTTLRTAGGLLHENGASEVIGLVLAHTESSRRG